MTYHPYLNTYMQQRERKLNNFKLHRDFSPNWPKTKTI